MSMKKILMLIIVLCMSLLLFGCSFRKDAEITTTTQETSSEAVVSTTTTPHPTREITVTPTPMPTPTSTPTTTPSPTLSITPTPAEEDEVLSFPDAEGLEVADDSSASFELYLDEVLYPTFGRLTENWEKDIKIGDFYPQRDYFEDISGVIGYSINDFDINGTNEMMVFGFAQFSNYRSFNASYRYTPYVALCSYVDGQISVTDVQLIGPDEPAHNIYGGCDISSSASYDYELAFQIIDNGDNISVAGWCDIMEKLIGNGAYSYCFEYSVENNNIVILTEVRQIRGGSDGFIFWIIGEGQGTLVAGIDDTNTSPHNMTENFGVFEEDADICICFEADRIGDDGHVSFTVITR